MCWSDRLGFRSRIRNERDWLGAIRCQRDERGEEDRNREKVDEEVETVGGAERIYRTTF